MRYLEYFRYKGKVLSSRDGKLFADSKQIPVKNDIPRFTPNTTYSTGNFSKLRKKHSQLQLDSVNGTNDRMNTILERTKWPQEFFRGKMVLECGCGAGADTEVLAKLGAKIISVDIAGVDIAKNNCPNNSIQFVQASLLDLPFRKKSFDIVFCHRVLQHTPNPKKTLDQILRYVKKDGFVFVHSYAKTPWQMLRWKYLLHPLTKKMNPTLLYKIVKAYAKPAYYVTKLTNTTRIGRIFNHIFIPFRNYSYLKKFKGKDDKFLIEYGIHDTFDALSPTYDIPLSKKEIDNIAKKHIKDYEITEFRTVTLLRTKNG